MRTRAAGGGAAASGTSLHRRRGAWKERNGLFFGQRAIFPQFAPRFGVCGVGAGATASPGAAAGPA